MESRYWYERGVIYRYSDFFMIFGWCRDPRTVSKNGSDKEVRKLYYWSIVRAVLLLIFVFFGIGYLVNSCIENIQAKWREAELQNIPTFRDAGTVVSVQLHETTFSTSTTVNTTGGTFQVSGAVTASPGDVTKMRSEKLSGEQSLCVESSYKGKCYRLL